MPIPVVIELAFIRCIVTTSLNVNHAGMLCEHMVRKRVCTHTFAIVPNTTIFKYKIVCAMHVSVY